MLGKIVAGLALALSSLGFGCSSSATDDGAAEPQPSEGDAVLDACLDFAARLCDDAASCCMAAYAGYDHAGCVESFRREVCRPGADAVAAGRATFDADAIEGCLAAHAQGHALCIPSWSETLELQKAIYGACRVIDGTTEVGRGCTTAVTCKRPPGLGTAECVKNTCRALEILAEGAACEFPSGSVSLCDAELTCSAVGPGELGVCEPAIAAGEPCDASILESTTCGLGSYCDDESETCKAAGNFGGPDCSQGTECVSFSCDRIAAECAPAPAVVSRETCLGPSP